MVITTLERKCLACGNILHVVRKTKKFCDSDCRWRYYYGKDKVSLGVALTALNKAEQNDELFERAGIMKALKIIFNVDVHYNLLDGFYVLGEGES